VVAYNYANTFGLKKFGVPMTENMISLISAGDVVVNVPNKGGEQVIAGFIYTKTGWINFLPDVNNIKYQIYLVGQRCAKYIDEQFFNPGANGYAFLYDRRMTGTTFNQMGIKVTTTSSDGSGGTLLVLELNWTETNIPI
jgi:hypothetical protein